MPSNKIAFDPKSDISTLTGKVLFVTGGTSGLGAGSVTEFARHSPAHIFFTGRNETSANALISRVKQESPKVPLTFIRCDISSFASVRSAVEIFQSSNTKNTSNTPRLDILMLNAGIMATKAAVSVDGYEAQFATNHLGHALLVKLLLPTLLSTAAQPGSDVRIINMSSYAHGLAPSEGIDFATLKSPQSRLGGAIIPGHTWSRYGQSKLAQILYSQQLALRYPQIMSVSVHPGFIFTGLWDNLGLLTKLPAMVVAIGRTIPVEQGYYNQVWAATTEKEKLRNGGYYEPMGKLMEPTVKHPQVEKLAGELWDWTEAQF